MVLSRPTYSWFCNGIFRLDSTLFWSWIEWAGLGYNMVFDIWSQTSEQTRLLISFETQKEILFIVYWKTQNKIFWSILELCLSIQWESMKGTFIVWTKTLRYFFQNRLLCSTKSPFALHLIPVMSRSQMKYWDSYGRTGSIVIWHQCIGRVKVQRMHWCNRDLLTSAYHISADK